jgi:uncharacterized protein YjiS (DUF1127 family)
MRVRLITESHPTLTAADRFAALLARAVATFRHVRKLRRDRREVKLLAEFDEHLLKDIGLLHTHVSAALDEPLARFPSRVLVRSRKNPAAARSPRG